MFLYWVCGAMSALNVAAAELNLSQLVDIYTQNAPALQAQQAKVQALEAELGGTTTWAAPDLAFTLGQNSQIYGGMSLGQEFALPGKRQSKTKVKNAEIKGAQLERQGVERQGRNQIIALAVQQYALQNAVAGGDSTLRNLQQLQNLWHNRSTAQPQVASVLLLQNQVAQVRREQTELRAQWWALWNQMQALVGADLKPVLWHAPDGVKLPSLDEILAQVSGKSELQAARQNLSVSAAQQEQITWSQRPDLLVQGNYMWQADVRDWSVMVGISLPFAPWANGENRSARQSLQAERLAAELNLKSQEQYLVAQIRSLYAQAQSLAQQIALIAAEQLPTLQQARAAIERTLLAEANLTQWLEVESQRRALLVEHIQLQAQYWQTVVALAETAGLSPLTWWPAWTGSEGEL